MEENIKVVTIEEYHDIELDEVIKKNKVRWLTEKRARELMSKNLIKLLEVRKCIHESR